MLHRFATVFQYFICAIAGSTVCFILGILFVDNYGGGDGLAIAFFAVFLGIPLGGMLGLSSVFMTQKRKDNTSVPGKVVGCLYFAGGLVGSMAGLFIAAKLALGWDLIIPGIVFGGLLGMLLVNTLINGLPISRQRN